MSFEAVADDHVALQTTTSRGDGITTLKRQKTRRPNQMRSRSAGDKNRETTRKVIDIEGCDEEEARRRIDAFWAPAELSFGSRSRSMAVVRPKPLGSPPEKPQTRQPPHRRYSDPSESPRSQRSESSAPEDVLRNQVQSFALKNTRNRSPRTPESLPREGSRDLRPTAKKSLDEGMKTLFLAPGEEGGDIKGLVPSSFKVKKRIEVAIERREKERLSAIQAAKELRLHRQWPRKAIVQPLSSTWEDLVAGAESRDHMKIITKSKEGTELRVKDFATLLGRHAWLNDEIINSYIEWVVLAANEDAVAQAVARGEKPSTVPKFIAHNSFFWENLKKKGAESTERLMKRKKAPGISLMEVDSVFVPICSGNHWTIGVVRPVAKTIEYFDSMGGRPPIFFKKMREWLGFQIGKQYVEGDWTEPRTACAEQTNGYDCGVFVCTNAFCVALGLNTECYEERDMALQRRNIAAVLINKGFSGDFAWNNGDLLH